MKAVIAAVSSATLLASPLAAQTMTSLLPTLTYPETTTLPSDPDRPSYPEVGPVTVPTVTSSTKDCHLAGTGSVCMVKEPAD